MTKTELKLRKERAQKMLKVLKKLFPKAGMALNYTTNYELLFAVILSAQCTDKMVNKVTNVLFKKYRTLDEYVDADLLEFEQDIRSTGFYKNKAKNILATARLLKEKFNGRLPETIEEMIELKGVGRKTANVVLGNAYGIVDGIAIDTHVRRTAIRFGLTKHKDAVRIERDLMEILPKKEWFYFTYYCIEYGRKICPARKHDCALHPLTVIYPKASLVWPKSK